MPKSGRSRRFGLLGDEMVSLEASHESGSRTNLTASFKAPLTSKSSNKLQSLFSPFSKQTQDQSNQLIDLLNLYTNNGLPTIPSNIVRGRPYFDPSSLALEDHWSDIVHNHTSLTKAQREQQEAIWELLSTEVEYIKKLKVIIDLFYSCLLDIQANHILAHIEIDKIFNNICDVFYSTTHFWNIHLSQVLRGSRESKAPLDPCLLKSGFQVFDRIFEPYVKYCLDQDQSRRYIKAKVNADESFRLFVNWAESQPQCNRLSLTDLLVRPFQRLTKYGLLLSALKKPLLKMEVTNTIEQQKKDIVKMVAQVEDFVVHVNRLMRQRQDHLLISSMIKRIDSYDVVDAPSDECSKVVDQFCRLDLLMPLPGCAMHETRNLLFEGSLKLKDTYTKMDVYCFLFTDMILITKPTAKRGDKVKVIKPPMRLDKIIVQGMRDVASFMLLYLNEYSIAQAVYTFHGDSKQWLARVTKAQRDYTAKKLSSPIRSLDPQSRFEASSHKKLFESSSLNMDKISFSSERRYDDDSGVSTHSGYHHPLSPSLSVYSHSSSKLSHDSPSPPFHHHHHNSYISVSNISNDSSSQKIDPLDTTRDHKRLMKIFDSDEELPESGNDKNPKESKKVSVVSTSSIDLSSLKGSYCDLRNVVSGETSTKPIATPTKECFKLKTHKKNPSDPIIIRTCHSVNNLCISKKDPEWAEAEIAWKEDQPPVAMIRSDPGFNANVEVISADEFEKSNVLAHCKSETNIMDHARKRNMLYFCHKPFKERIYLSDDASKIEKHKTEKLDLDENISEEKNSTLLEDIPCLSVHKKSIPRSSTSDSNDEFFDISKDCTDEIPTETKDNCQNTFGKLLENDAEPKDEKNTKNLSTVIISISKDENSGKSSQSLTPPEDEFHLCFSPEDYNRGNSSQSSNNKKFLPQAPTSAVIVVETASQTSIDLLISGYWEATTSVDESLGGNNHYRTVSLPNIFEVVPSACRTLNSLIRHNNQTKLSLIETS